ncbi:putative lipid-binding transport protein (Tim44 family) [Comamonas odontotermitis]|uniref:Lipid-binding transport protein (Tim44 family) n=1 Tax=Comamonas odontotermitis TaxID=379895 RepID=A0ABR6RLF0_9BURK|nr:DUF4124 domain-containing protein [Comamonas odontotermitis]MBB6579982.1 putative lipid-binding transport protein (Tim44 family) [Comamonas odontotermitis]
MSKIAMAVLGLLVSMGGGAGNAWAINKCVDANGRTSFQDEPCAAGQKAQEVVVTPSSRGVNPAEGSKPSAPRSPSASGASGASAPAAQAGTGAERPSDCPSAQEMQRLQVEAESVALPLPIRNQKRQDFEALKQRCG